MALPLHSNERMTYKALWLTGLFTFAMGCTGGVVADRDEDGSAEGELRHFTNANLERPEVGEIKVIHPDEPGTVGICTGTLIGRRTVLTAAHCFHFDTKTQTSPIGHFYIQPKDGSAKQRYSFSRERVGGSTWEPTADLAVIQLDTEVPSSLARPAEVDDSYADSDDEMTVYGYGHWGSDCEGAIDGNKRKWTTAATGVHKYISCPGDSGGAYFSERTGKIVSVVKANFIWEVFADPIGNRDWIVAKRDQAECGTLND
jgi:hypothetical protein